MSKKIKLAAFTPFTLGSTAFYDWCGKAAKSDKTMDVLELFMARDPGATDWSSVGLICPMEEGRPVHDLDGTARLLAFQFNERILPASVRDEKLRDEIKRISEKEGRDLGKKEYAQIKEDVEFSLLPKAFIRRSIVYVMVFKDRLFVFTTSAKKCETVVGRLNVMTQARKVEFDCMAPQTENSIGYFLGQMARLGVDQVEDDGVYTLHTLTAAVFKGQGEDKRTIRIKDRDISAKEVHDILNQPNYGVTELFMQMYDEAEGDALLDFVFTDRFVFKGIKLSDMASALIGGDTDDRHAFFWLIAKTYLALLDRVLLSLNDESVDDTDDL